MVDVLEQKKLDVQEFLNMDFPDDGFIYELINGILVRRSSPNAPHQDVIAELFPLIKFWVKQRKLGKAYTSPFDVFFGDRSAIQPDIFFIAQDRDHIITNEVKAELRRHYSLN